MSNFTVTLDVLRQNRACYGGYNRLIRYLQRKRFTKADAKRETYINFKYDQPISLVTILESNGLYDAVWTTRCLVGVCRDIQWYTVWCARQVQHIMHDPRSITALDVSEEFLRGRASAEEHKSAMLGAIKAGGTITAERAYGAEHMAAEAAAWAAGCVSSGDTSLDVSPEDTSLDVSLRITIYSIWTIEKKPTYVDAQKEMFIKMCNGQAPWQ